MVRLVFTFGLGINYSLEGYKNSANTSWRYFFLWQGKNSSKSFL